MVHRARALLLALLVPLAVAQAQDHRPADALPAPHDGDRRGTDDYVDRPAAPLRVHEWGVWQLDASGRPATLSSLSAEAPPFVHRPVATPQQPELPDPFIPGSGPGENFDKPVIFLYADATLSVNVTVRVPHGRPWLYFPDANVGRVHGTPGLQWTGQVVPVGVAVNGTTLPDVTAAPYAWWNVLRGVNASPFLPSGATTYEKFLYYDGQAPFPAGFRAHGNDITPIAGRTEPIAWRVDGQHFVHLDVHGAQATATDLAGQPAFRDELVAALHAHGLSPAETNALLATWAPALFTGARHVVWLLPRAAYDAMLPIQVNPTPLELVRVGVVIQHY